MKYNNINFNKKQYSSQELQDLLGSNLCFYFQKNYPESTVITFDLFATQFFTQANIETTKEYLNYEPQYSLEEGIKAYVPDIKQVFKDEVK